MNTTKHKYYNSSIKANYKTEVCICLLLIFYLYLYGDRLTHINTPFSSSFLSFTSSSGRSYSPVKKLSLA